MLLCMAEKKISIGTVKKIYYFFFNVCLRKNCLSYDIFILIVHSCLKQNAQKSFINPILLFLNVRAHNFANKSLLVFIFLQTKL